MTGSAYLDTSALADMFIGTVAGASAEERRAGETVAKLLGDRQAVVALSELTIVEVHGVLAKYCRMTERPACDETWFDASVLQLMELIAQRRLLVVEHPARGMEHAMVLVTLATREHGSKFFAQDALHLITAVRWSTQIGRIVDFYACDSDFDRFVTKYLHFRRYVNLMTLR